jgi:hypothetical protein
VPDRPAHLHRQRQRPQFRACFVDPGHPPSHDEPERGRDRVLQERAAHQACVPVQLSQPRRRVGSRARIGEQWRQRTPRHQHHRGVDDVLRGRARVRLREPPGERHDRGGVLGRLSPELGNVDL